MQGRGGIRTHTWRTKLISPQRPNITQLSCGYLLLLTTGMLCVVSQLESLTKGATGHMVLVQSSRLFFLTEIKHSQEVVI